MFQYKCDNFYAPQADGGISIKDDSLGIDRKIPTENELLSYGIWAQKGSPYDMNNSDPICIDVLEPTDFAHSHASMMSITDYGQEAIDEVIKTLEMYEDKVNTHTMHPITSKEVDKRFMFEDL